MQIKKIFLFCILILSNVFLFGQNTAQSPDKLPEGPAPKAERVVEETVEGVWELTGYLGKKLLNEMSNRMNLGDTPLPSSQKTKKVTIKVGPFKIERIESDN